MTTIPSLYCLLSLLCNGPDLANGSRIWLGGGGGGRFYGRGGTLTMNVCEARGEYTRFFQKGEFRPATRKAEGGGCPLQVRYKKWGGGGGGGRGCLPYDDAMIYIFVLCERA